MIETGKQAQEAIDEIKNLTHWSLRRISIKSGISNPSLVGIISGKTLTPNEATLKKLNDLLSKAREM